MQEIKKQIEILKKILNATEREIYDRQFLLNAIKEYGISPLSWLQELDENCNYTENGMIQVPGEFASFCQLIADIEVHTAAEVGVYRGRSSYFICAILYRNNPDLRYDMIDIEDYLDGFDEFHKVLPCLRKCIPSTSADYKKQQYDFVFIDADHSYEGAMDDYLNIGRYAKKIVCFHDIYAHEYDSLNGGVVRCWNEVCALTPQHPKAVFSQFPAQNLSKRRSTRETGNVAARLRQSLRRKNSSIVKTSRILYGHGMFSFQC
jgi:predicted O-methyltransferase YrrM